MKCWLFFLHLLFSLTISQNCEYSSPYSYCCCSGSPSVINGDCSCRGSFSVSTFCWYFISQYRFLIASFFSGLPCVLWRVWKHSVLCNSFSITNIITNTITNPITRTHRYMQNRCIPDLRDSRNLPTNQPLFSHSRHPVHSHLQFDH